MMVDEIPEVAYCLIVFHRFVTIDLWQSCKYLVLLKNSVKFGFGFVCWQDRQADFPALRDCGEEGIWDAPFLPKGKKARSGRKIRSEERRVGKECRL